MLEEPILCSFGLSEPEAGSDVAKLKTTAERRGDEYVLNGSKTFITNAGHAAWTVVFAKTDPAKGHKGMSAFIVPMDTPGVQMEKHLDKMGQRATDTSAFALTDVVVPAENRIGEEGEGFKIAMQTLDFTRPGTAAGAVGVAQAAYEHAVEYAKQRVTFDVPIAMHQGVSFMIADMATEIAAARLLVWQAAWLHDQGQRATLESSFAKRFSADTAMKVTTDAVQVFGGYGYMKEYPVEKLMRDAKLFQIYEGTSQIQRLVIAKEIFLPRGVSAAHGRARAGRAAGSRARSGRRRASAASALGLGLDRRDARRRRRPRAGRRRSRRRGAAHQPPTTRPSHQTVGPALPFVSKRIAAVRAEVPVALLPAHRRRVERRQERGRRLGAAASARGRPRARSRSPPSSSTSACGTAASAARVSRSGPAGPPADVGLGGRAERREPAAEQLRLRRRRRRARSIGPPSQSSVVTQRNWGLIHVPRGRPRTSSALHRELR